MSEPTSRHIGQTSYRSYATRVKRWAVIVGISTYAHERLNLRFADRDAEALSSLLQSPTGGGYEPQRIMKLVNEQATTANITRALRSFLKRPARDDVVLLYFACHAAPDPERPGQVYLVSHDTDPDDIAATGVPMREINLALTEQLLAERVVIIADTCHSAAIGRGPGDRAMGDGAEAVNAYLERMSRAKGGVALLTSAERVETAKEGPQWGGGHGVFTHFLLTGMRGEADGYGEPKDGVVSVGELFEYVRDQVISATGSNQHPTIGTSAFDRYLPMAITGGLDAREHHRLGDLLCELGWWLEDPGRFLDAADQYQEAIRLSTLAGATLQTAELGLGRALLAAGDFNAAVAALAPLAADADGGKAEAASALWHLGLAQAGRHDRAAARQAFERFLATSPDSALAAWVRDYIDRLAGSGPRRRALLIGINDYLDPDVPRLAGCANDVAQMRQALTAHAGFAPEDIETLLDGQATAANIRTALARLASEADVEDVVLVHFSGMGFGSVGEPDHEPRLIVHDSRDKASSISASDLYLLLATIPSKYTSLILDARSSAHLERLSAGIPVLLLACDHSASPQESSMRVGDDTVPAGAFTAALVEQLARLGSQSLTLGRWVEATARQLRDGQVEQRPVLLGPAGRLALAGEDLRLAQFLYAQRRGFPTATRASIKFQHFRLRTPGAPLPGLRLAMGLAYLAVGDATSALHALEIEIEVSGPSPGTLLALTRAMVGARRYRDAAQCCRQYRAALPVEASAEATDDLVAALDRLSHAGRRALLVGIDTYACGQAAPLQGAVNDALAMRHTLIRRFGFKASQITLLTNAEATRAAILAQFDQLVLAAREEPALFYFAGYGSTRAGDGLTLVPADSRQGEVFDIALADLQAMAQRAPGNLVTVIDAGWTLASIGKGEGTRCLPGDERVEAQGRAIGRPRRVAPHALAIGRVSIYGEGVDVASSTAVRPKESEVKRAHPGALSAWHGRLTDTLLRGLRGADAATLTYERWLEAAQQAGGSPRAVGQALDAVVLDPATRRHEALARLAEIDSQPVQDAIGHLSRLVEQRQKQGMPVAVERLNLGVAHALVGEFGQAIGELERARAAYDDPQQLSRALERDPRREAHGRELGYQLGRVLFESGENYTRAVAQLGEAIKRDPDNARAFFYHGQAIRRMVGVETLARAEQSFAVYLSHGAPLGHEDEVRDFLRERREAAEAATGTRPSEPGAGALSIWPLGWGRPMSR
ncbi:MAG: caspase family protein [Burkholderiaceae bacterium]|nr:caspase family protein [Burkholderiaceae bacterium]